jgi:hypothetical protein
MSTIRIEADFSGWIAEEKRELEKLVGTLSRRLSSDILSRLVLASPVDTGRFRGNWQMDVGRFIDDELAIEDKSGAITISRELAKLRGSSAPFTIITIQNNLPYAGRLNDGHSRQAPAGFVEAAIDQAVSPFR